MNLTQTHNAEGRKPSLCSSMALSLFQVHCTCPQQGLPSLWWPSLPSFSGAPVFVAALLPPHVSPCPAQHLCQQAYLTIAGSTATLPPSWNPIGPVAILSLAFLIFFFTLFMLKVPEVFSSAYKKNFKLMYETAYREVVYFCPLSIPNSWPPSFPSSLSSQWLLWSISNKSSDDSSKTIGGVFSLECFCFSTGYMGSIVQITTSICSPHL